MSLIINNNNNNKNFISGLESSVQEKGDKITNFSSTNSPLPLNIISIIKNTFEIKDLNLTCKKIFTVPLSVAMSSASTSPVSLFALVSAITVAKIRNAVNSVFEFNKSLADANKEYVEAVVKCKFAKNENLGNEKELKGEYSKLSNKKKNKLYIESFVEKHLTNEGSEENTNRTPLIDLLTEDLKKRGVKLEKGQNLNKIVENLLIENMIRDVMKNCADEDGLLIFFDFSKNNRKSSTNDNSENNIKSFIKTTKKCYEKLCFHLKKDQSEDELNKLCDIVRDKVWSLLPPEE